MKVFLSAIIVYCFYSSALAESFQDLNDRVGVIEQQVAVSCKSPGDQTDPVRVQIAERVLSSDGAATEMLQTIKQGVERTNYALDHAEEIVTNMHTAQLDQQKDQAESKLNAALKKLNSSNGRAPASVSDNLREEVRKAYGEYQTSRQPVKASQMFRGDLNNFRKSKVSDLNHYADLGTRLDHAVKKASACYCRSGASDCKNVEQLKADTELLGARTAYHNADSTAHRDSGGSSTGSAH